MDQKEIGSVEVKPTNDHEHAKIKNKKMKMLKSNLN
jgi:hypothetical protein